MTRVTSTTGMSTPRGGVDGTVNSNSYGFGFSYVRFTGIVDTLLVSSTTPIDEERVDHRFSFTIRKLPDKDVTQGVGKAFIRCVNASGDAEIARYDLSEDGSTEAAMIFGEVYRNGADWKFRAIGQGFQGGLGPLAKNYGVNV